MMKKLLCIFVGLLTTLALLAEVNLLPMPQKVTEKSGEFCFTRKTWLYPDDTPGAKATVLRLQKYWHQKFGKKNPANTFLPEKGNYIAFYGDSRLAEGAYTIKMYPDRIEVRASSEEGFRYAEQTLKQLIVGKHTPMMDIEDWPVMSWRGLHFDDCRHFFGKQAVTGFIDRMAYYKMNVLHWHLTDDQAWRIEIKGFPELTTVGAVRPSSPKRGNRDEQDGVPYGPYYYTQDDIREVVRYAHDKGVKVVPEFELPGHGYAAIAAYPYLACNPNGLPYRHPRLTWGIEEDVFCIGNDSTLSFIYAVLNQICDLFDSDVIHIGGDEAPRNRWRQCAKCQARKAAEGLDDEDALQYWLVNRVAEYVAAKGKRIIGWSEIYNESLPASAMLMSWQDVSLGTRAAASGHDVVMCPYTHCYLDYSQQIEDDTLEYFCNVLPLSKVYAFDPFAEAGNAEKSHIIGIQGNNWSEYTWSPAELMFKAFPRAAALAEIGWSNPKSRDLQDFIRRYDLLQPVGKPKVKHERK